jgi:AraC-like DNA-binding protein
MRILQSQIVAGCFAGLREETLLESALDRLGALRRIEDRRTLVRAVARQRPSLVMLPSVDTAGRSTAPIARRCADLAPGTAVVVLVATGNSRRSIARAGRTGATLLCVQHPTELRRAIADLLDRPCLTRRQIALVRRVLGVLGEPLLSTALLQVASHANRRITVDALARELAMSRRTLTRRLRAACLPPPSEVILWGRLLCIGIAVRMAAAQQATPAALTETAEFCGAPTFRRACSSLLLLGERADVATITVGSTLAALRKRLTALRAAARSPRRHGLVAGSVASRFTLIR